jgi:hypothetical protein
MITYFTNSERCPEELQANERFILNIFINGQRGGLGPFTVEKISSYAEMDADDVVRIINDLMIKNLIQSK